MSRLALPTRGRDSTDKELVEAAITRAKQGDMEGFYFLYVQYGEHVLRYLNSLVKDHHEAEELTQNVFLKLITVINSYESREVPFIAWVLRVARNMALDHLRDRRSIPSEDVAAQVDDHRQIGEERRGDISWALDQLSDEQRNVLVLRHIHGLSPPEIAAVLGKTESAIDGLHHRGRKKAQAALIELDAAPVVTRPAV